MVADRVFFYRPAPYCGGQSLCLANSLPPPSAQSITPTLHRSPLFVGVFGLPQQKHAPYS